MLKLRPHHLTLFVQFYNEGIVNEYYLNLMINNYGKDLVKDMVELFTYMKQNPDEKVNIVYGPDYICGRCALSRKICGLNIRPKQDDKNIDDSAIDVYGFQVGSIITVRDIVKTIGSIDENKYLHYNELKENPGAARYMEPKFPREDADKLALSEKLLNSILFQREKICK